MKIGFRAFHIGQKINTKNLLKKLKFDVKLKEPLVLEYSNDKYIVLFRFGVVVFCNLNDVEILKFLKLIKPHVVGMFVDETEEKLETVSESSRDEVKRSKIYLSKLTPEKVAIVSVVLSRSMVLDYFENEVSGVLGEIGYVINSFAKKGKSPLSNRMLLQKVGLAMQIENMSVNQMAVLDKPEITWEDATLDGFYLELVEEFEIEERYDILKDKLSMLFKSVEFILGYIDGRRGLFLELIIVLLIVFEIAIFFVELAMK